jgi:hypothetical protein
MTANMTTQATRAITPTSASRCASGITSTCECGGAGCANCLGQGYVRPRFFAGQLLTEDDLRSLDDYVVAKNRLHMRDLFGAGVVCGLTVTCEPCGGGKVIVNPGYALDCCGNDIVVSCPQTLDINLMIREFLLKTRGGYDCSDPCVTVSPTGSRQTPATKDPPTPRSRRYCLYVDYCEELTEPVAPYVVNDPCGATSCEPTRVREGFRFELRCPPDCDDTPAICDRLVACIGDSPASERSILDAGFLRPYAARLRRAGRVVQERRSYMPPEHFDEWLEHHVKQLGDAVARFQEDGRETIDEAALNSVLDAATMLGGGLARYWLRTDIRGTERYVEHIQAAAKVLHGAFDSVTNETVEHVFPTTLPRTYALQLRAIALHLAQRLLSGTEPPRAVEPSPTDDLPVHYLAAGVVLNRAMATATVQALNAMRDWLVVHLENRRSTTRCALPKEVGAVSLPSAHGELGLASGESLGKSAEVLCRAMRDVMKDCFCDALSPPCPSCDDTGVLLACLTVRDCEIEEICNLERTSVITGPTIRYWLPQLSLLGEAIEKWCCSSRDECREETDDELPTAAHGDSLLRGALGPIPAEVESALATIFGACPPPFKGKRQLAPRAPVGRLLSMPSAHAASEAAIMATVDRVTAELRGELGRLREEIEGLRSKQSARGGGRARGRG